MITCRRTVTELITLSDRYRDKSWGELKEALTVARKELGESVCAHCGRLQLEIYDVALGDIDDMVKAGLDLSSIVDSTDDDHDDAQLSLVGAGYIVEWNSEDSGRFLVTPINDPDLLVQLDELFQRFLGETGNNSAAGEVDPKETL